MLLWPLLEDALSPPPPPAPHPAQALQYLAGLSATLHLHYALWNPPNFHLLGRIKPTSFLRIRLPLVLLVTVVPSSAGASWLLGPMLCPERCGAAKGERIRGTSGRPGQVHWMQVLLNLQLPTKLPVQPQEQKSVVREGHELISLNLT